ncbi:hypothetical protein [Pseudonocardia acidicola]|uniref:Zinc finger protein n=1 Tax=Pseudonocardia acidicola TaxID=2724939 RepID=A0ABX1SFP3_9PSEU|nr:hypothetical protein [Pseudonocardia acidicola]NMI00371.1 hypothetical protein [Pseudonocardia acidicola]
MTEAGCMRCHGMAAELALGVATGRERAEAVVHLQACPACRAEIDDLTRVHDRLRALIPYAEPPLGFETRVLERIGPPRRRPDRARRILVAAAVAVALLGGGWGLAATMTPRPPTPVAAGERTLLFAPLMTDGHETGQAFGYLGNPSWIYMYMEDVQPGQMLSCAVLRRDGARVVVGDFPAKGNDSFWGAPVPIERSTLAAIEVSDATTSRVLARADFAAPS